MQASHFLTRSLQDQRIARVLSAAVEAAEPGPLVADYLAGHPLPVHRRLFLLGIGKAAEGMTRAAAARVEAAGALVVTKQATSTTPGAKPSGKAREAFRTILPIEVLEAGHPIPDDRSLAAGKIVRRFVAELEGDDLLICLFSGGASALVAAPLDGVTLADLQSLTDELLRSGATINDINVLRRQLDGLKGGGLAAATRASILSLILSDVIGDDLEAIASGPTAVDRTTPAMVAGILQSYGIHPSPSIVTALRQPKVQPAASDFDRVSNVIIGNNRLSVIAARDCATREGFDAEVMALDVHGEARDVGVAFASTLRRAAPSRSRPFCLIAGGETTVSLRMAGKGGRNQELALAAVDTLDGLQSVLLISFATDGNDGPTDAAGAVATGDTLRRASEMGMHSTDYLARHDSYAFFDALGDLLLPGYTGTNVNDLILLVGL